MTPNLERFVSTIFHCRIDFSQNARPTYDQISIEIANQYTGIKEKENEECYLHQTTYHDRVAKHLAPLTMKICKKLIYEHEPGKETKLRLLLN